MFRLLFGFRGTLDRKGFALGFLLSFVGLTVWALLVVLLSMGGGIVAIFLGVRNFREGTPAYTALLYADLAAIILPYFWSVAATGAKRFRSIGLNPLVCTPLWFSLPVLDAFVFQRVLPERTLLGTHGAILGLALHFGALAFLLGWPGKSGDSVAPAPAASGRTAGAYRPISTPRAAFGQRS